MLVAVPLALCWCLWLCALALCWWRFSPWRVMLVSVAFLPSPCHGVCGVSALCGVCGSVRYLWCCVIMGRRFVWCFCAFTARYGAICANVDASPRDTVCRMVLRALSSCRYACRAGIRSVFEESVSLCHSGGIFACDSRAGISGCRTERNKIWVGRGRRAVWPFHRPYILGRGSGFCRADNIRLRHMACTRTSRRRGGTLKALWAAPRGSYNLYFAEVVCDCFFLLCSDHTPLILNVPPTVAPPGHEPHGPSSVTWKRSVNPE